MKKTVIWMLALVLLLTGCLAGAGAEWKTIEPNMALELSEAVSGGIVKTHEFTEGVAPLTGLPASGEPYTPIALILDDSPEVFPHWGVAEADWIVQTPLRRDGATRLMAVYGNEYPEQAGGARSSRMTNLPVAVMFHAALAFAGHPPVVETDINVEHWIGEWDYNKPYRFFNLLNGRYQERVDFLEAPQNMSAHVKEMHEALVKRGVKFQNRGFLFTDEPLSRGEDAQKIQLQWYGLVEKDAEIQKPVEHAASHCEFSYTEQGYLRDSSTGLYVDRNEGDPLAFANVVILRSPIRWIGHYPYYDNHLKTCGQAEIFQNGKHITGAWYRAGRLTRLVLLDENGQEISLQRGKTYLAIGDEHLVVSCE